MYPVRFRFSSLAWLMSIGDQARTTWPCRFRRLCDGLPHIQRCRGEEHPLALADLGDLREELGILLGVPRAPDDDRDVHRLEEVLHEPRRILHGGVLDIRIGARQVEVNKVCPELVDPEPGPFARVLEGVAEEGPDRCGEGGRTVEDRSRQ